jgi:hypothetical protein
MNKMLKFAALAIVPVAMVGCGGAESTAEECVDAILENDQLTLSEVVHEDSLEEVKATAKAIAEKKDEVKRYMLENMTITKSAETDSFAMVIYSTKVPMQFDIKRIGDEWVMDGDISRVYDFDAELAQAYFEEDSKADIYGEDALDNYMLLISDVEDYVDYMVDVREADLERKGKSGNDAKVSDKDREELAKNMRKLSIEESETLLNMIDKMGFESYEDYFNSIDFIHEKPVPGNDKARITYITIDVPRAGELSLVKDDEGKWKVIDVD